jgi:VWFA-related protein
MHRFHVVANVARECLAGLADRLYGCSHSQKAFPITLGTETYVVCLVCGRHFAYDWATMRITTGPWWRQRPGVAIGLFLPWLLLAGAVDDAPAQPYRLSVNVNLVELHATVRDPKGHFASDLREQDFDVYEHGVRQSIRFFRHEDIPVTVGLVVDHSGSMRHKLADVTTPARTFVHSSGVEDEMFVVNFNEHVTLGLPDAIRFTNRSDELARDLQRACHRQDGAVRRSDPGAGAIAIRHPGKECFDLISDGGDNASTHSLAEVLRAAGRSGALVYTIGIFDADDPDRHPNVLKRLAEATGGEALFPGQVNEVIAACERIARDIRHQYTLGYIPSNPAQPTGYRAIRVAARASGKDKLSVRTRSGYMATGESRPAPAR